MAVYKVLAEEIDGAELAYPTEILMGATNTQYSPVAASGSKPANPAIEVQTAITNAQANNNTLFATSVTDFSNGSSSFTVDSALSIVPPIGTWLILFSSACETTGVNVEAAIELFVSGVAIADSLREIRISTAVLGVINLSTNSVAAPCNIITRRTFNGTTDTLTVRTRVVNGNGNVVLGARSITLLQVGLT